MLGVYKHSRNKTSRIPIADPFFTVIDLIMDPVMGTGGFPHILPHPAYLPANRTDIAKHTAAASAKRRLAPNPIVYPSSVP